MRRSEAVALRLDQIQRREGDWVIADLFGKGGRLRTVPVPDWCKSLIDSWLRASGVSEGSIFRRIWKNRSEPGSGVAADVVWTAVMQHASGSAPDHLAPRMTFVAMSNSELCRIIPSGSPWLRSFGQTMRHNLRPIRAMLREESNRCRSHIHGAGLKKMPHRTSLSNSASDMTVTCFPHV